MHEAEFARGLEQFAFHLHDQLAQANPDQNVVCSPLSIRTSAGMLRMGATEGSATAVELDQGLRFSTGDVQSIAKCFESVLKAYKQCSILKMANRLYLMQGFEVNEQFGSLLEKKFQARPIEIDFGRDQAADEINGWVESQTDHLIQNIITPNVLSSDTRLVLVNAIYFKGEWAIKFNKGDTNEEQFFSDPKQPITVSMMHTTHMFSFGELSHLEATALRLDYSACNLAMVILLPHETSSLTDLEKKLAGTSMEAISSKMTQAQVDVKIPKFKAEFQQELSNTFKMMDMNRIFDDQAELGEILSSGGSLSVSKIIHKTFIEVNETGTKAAASTAVVATTRSWIPQNQPKVFHANRPFFYAIFDSVHGFLFVGHFNPPRSGRSAKCTGCDIDKSCNKCDRCKQCHSKGK